MTEVETPIDIGALYRDSERSDEHNTYLRVRRIWVSEDLKTVIKFRIESLGHRTVGEGSVTLEDFVERIEKGELSRHNSDHEAYIWRQD